MDKHCCQSLLAMSDHTDHCLSRTAEIKRLNTLVETLSRALLRYQDEEAESDPGRPCQCGREVFISRDGTRRCPGCEYMEASTCDCAPEIPRTSTAECRSSSLER